MTLQTCLTTIQYNPVPPQAAAVGYNTLTFGPNVTLGSNWQLFNLLNVTPMAGQATQQGDGSILLTADGSNFGGNICSAKKVSGGWSGTAFGGGFYVEFVVKFPGNISSSPGTLPFPAVWSDEINFLSGNPASWPGQASNYYHWIEFDFLQWAQDTILYWGAPDLIDWYGTSPSVNVFQPTNSDSHMYGALFSNYNTYGCLYVPATSTSQGYMQGYLNNKLAAYAAGTPATVKWNLYSASNPPPPVGGTTAFSFVDQCKLAMIAGTSSLNPMTMLSFKVWQASSANNITR